MRSFAREMRGLTSVCCVVSSSFWRLVLRGVSRVSCCHDGPHKTRRFRAREPLTAYSSKKPQKGRRSHAPRTGKDCFRPSGPCLAFVISRSALVSQNPSLTSSFRLREKWRLALSFRHVLSSDGLALRIRSNGVLPRVTLTNEALLTFYSEFESWARARRGESGIEKTSVSG